MFKLIYFIAKVNVDTHHRLCWSGRCRGDGCDGNAACHLAGHGLVGCGGMTRRA